MTQKTVKQLENELQAARDAAKKIEVELNQKKIEADKKAARLKAANEKQAKKTKIQRKAELDAILIEYEDLVEPVSSPVVKKKTSAPSVKSASAPKSAKSKQNGFLALLNKKI